MSGPEAQDTQPLPLTLAARVDQVCDGFESAWRAGSRPRLEDFLGDLPEPGRSHLLRELIAAELELRWASGERPTPEEYAGRFPGQDRLITEAWWSAMTAVRDLESAVETRVHTETSSGAAASPGALPEAPAARPGVVEASGESTRAAEAGRYRVIRLHARGGLGEVFLAHDLELNREVALKQIGESHADDPTSRARFLLEAEITGGLEHPGIVPVYGLGSHSDGRPYYAMRFIRGDSLKEAIGRFHADEELKHDRGRRSLELRKLLRRLLDVCNAVDYAHSRGVLHRDLKPGNVIIGRHGEALVVDWGLAKATGQADPTEPSPEKPLIPSPASGSADTLPGSALGTPAYMSPEQAAGDLDRLGPRSDVYSLGATLYSLLTGQPPFEGTNVRQVLEAVQRGEVVPPRALDRSIDPALEAVCLKAMALEPGGRYTTPRMLSDELERWMADEPVLARREPRAERWSRWMRHHRAWTFSAAAALIIVTIVSIAAALMVEHARQHESRARQAESIARAQASIQRDRAETNFRLAQRAVEDYLTRVSENTLLKAQDRQDLREMRKQLLEDALRYYRQFIDQRGDDPKQRADLADAYSRVSMITDEIGSQDEAVRASEQALVLAERLWREDPRSPVARERLAKILNTLGAFRRTLGAMDAALSDLTQARSLLEPLIQEHPDVAAYRHDLALTYNRIAIIQGETGNPAGALESYGLARGILETLVGKHSGEVRHRGFLGILVNNIGLLRQELDDSSAALRDYRQAAEVFGSLARDQPSDPQWQNLLAAACNDAGVILGDLEGPEPALRELRKALAIHLQVTRRHPSVSQFQDDLARTYMNIGHMELKAGGRAAALASMQRSLEIREELRRANPAIFWNQNQVATTYLNIGGVQLESGELAAAEQSFRQALAIQAPLVAANPEKPNLVSALGTITYRLGQAQLAAGHPAEAAATMAEAIRHHRVALTRSPRVENYRRLLAENYFALAVAQRALGRPAEALATARTGLKLAPGDPKWLYEAARDVARCGPEAGDEAMALLRRAIAAGFRDASQLAADPVFRLLRPRADFQELQMDLEFPADPFAPLR
jgi:serine/threonine-protein kinase